MPTATPPPVLADFITATQTIVTAAQALAAHGVASDVAEGRKALETAREAASTALKASKAKKA